MEISFIIFMMGIMFLATVTTYLIVTHRNRSCGNCKFYHSKGAGKVGGTCQGFGHYHYHWECCDEWKRRPTQITEDDL